MRTIAIIDDEQRIRQLYQNYVEKWAKQNQVSVRIHLFASAEEFLFEYEENKDFQVILLDIEMKAISGVELAKRIRQRDDKVQIIFISGYSEYIGEGYEVEALHFLVKPIAEEKLFAVLDKAVSKGETTERFVLMKEGDEQHKVYLGSIYYIVADKNYLLISGQDFCYRIRMTLNEIGQILDQRFFRLSRSEIVNIEKVESFSKSEMEMTDGKRFVIPRGKFNELSQTMISYF